MGARHETEVVISPTIESELGKFYSGLPRLLCDVGARPGAGQARTGQEGNTALLKNFEKRRLAGNNETRS